MPGTSSHTRIRLTGKGMKKVNGYGHGDHYVVLKIQVPKHLSAKQKALVQAYAELETDTPGQILGVTMKTDGEFIICSIPIKRSRILLHYLLMVRLCVSFFASENALRVNIIYSLKFSKVVPCF
jgi:hypothetical protein